MTRGIKIQQLIITNLQLHGWRYGKKTYNKINIEDCDTILALIVEVIIIWNAQLSHCFVMCTAFWRSCRLLTRKESQFGAGWVFMLRLSNAFYASHLSVSERGNAIEVQMCIFLYIYIHIWYLYHKVSQKRPVAKPLDTQLSFLACNKCKFLMFESKWC